MLTFRQFIEEQEKKKKMTKSGGGEYGTDELTKTYKKDTPGQELDEASVEKAVRFFIDYHRKNKNKKIDRNIWDVARMAGMKYRQLEDALAKEAVRNSLPREIKADLEKILADRNRARKTLQKYAHVY